MVCAVTEDGVSIQITTSLALSRQQFFYGLGAKMQVLAMDCGWHSDEEWGTGRNWDGHVRCQIISLL